MVLLIEQTGTSWNSRPRTTKMDSQLCDDSEPDGLAQVIMVMVGGLISFPFFIFPCIFLLKQPITAN